MANQIERDVFVLQNAYQQPIPYVRFTNAIPIVFNFQDYDIPDGSTVNAYCAKPSGAAVYTPAELSGNTVTITVTDQMFIELGVTILQVQIANGDSTLVTFGWPVNVQPNGTEGDIPPSQNESSFWNQLQQQVTDAVNNCNEATENANTATESAEQATQAANLATTNANEAAQQVFDQQYILTTNYTFPASGTVQPTAYGNAIVQEADGAIYQGTDPSPENPQFIYGIGDTGFFDGELLQGYYNASGVFTSDANYVCSANSIPCIPNDNIAVILENSATGVIISFYQEDGTFISQSTETSATAPVNTAYFMISINQSGITPETAGHIAVTINNNYAVIFSTENESENQSSRTYIPISAPLYSGDKIYQKDMQCRVYRQWAVAVFDGSADETWTEVPGSLQYSKYYRIPIGEKGYGIDNNVLCNKFTNVPISATTQDIGCDIFSSSAANAFVFAVRPGIDTVTDLSAFKTWLQSNPIAVIYQLTTPTDEPLSDAGVIAMYSLMACDELTNVRLMGANENLTPNNIIKFPRNNDGALLTTTRANGVRIELKDQNEDLTTITQQIATLNQFMASFDGKTLLTT